MKLCLGDRDQWPDSTLVDRGRAMPAKRSTARSNSLANGSAGASIPRQNKQMGSHSGSPA